ncbi:YeeE/YedE family protein [Paracraurococcus lichenis]|uniref:YeeE/YedE family protein n=1 Tax=Paracraurococcus lichenis TaxID=3064888 RepID=A0ABT9E3B3_9PROT|nr:YeeE/YedE family protein [Paracraurococcus sp. LOR1-02]MDO9710657.1 YeeE/YedE family protein [Paracraurococcus sp. LOR1-02]
MSATTLAAAPSPARLAGINTPAALGAGALLALGALAIGQAASPRQAALYLLGGALGLVLYHAAFGFTSAWRVFIADRRGEGLRAQMAMLAIAVLLFFPALSAGSLWGQPVTGNVSPIGVSLLAGAFMFGIGMQIGGGCASGTLYTVGGGSVRMLLTLAAFVAGSALGAAHFHWWQAQWHLAPISLVKDWGVGPALALNLVLFGAIAAGTAWLERRRHGALVAARPAPRQGLARFLRGPWPVLAGAVALALLNFATLALAGKPWGITSAFALWGSKAAMALGVDAAGWPYWSTPHGQAALAGSVLDDVTSVMDFGIVLGALLASALAGRFSPSLKVPLRSALAAVIGGLMLGYGARLAYGCNIGAYFSGIASGSLHGWVWMAAAFAGSVIGTRLRPLFGLEVERTPRQAGC